MRHRWKAVGNHNDPGPKYWRCVQCDLLRINEWEEKPEYSMRDGSTWHRFVPPCPPNSKDELTAIAERLGPNATTEQLTEAFRNNPQAVRELTNLAMECEAEAADKVLRQALTIIKTAGWP
jgi:hypothetical protein